MIENWLQSMCKHGKIKSGRQQRYICNLLNGHLNKKIGKYACDIVFQNEMLIIEYDGSGHRMSVTLGGCTNEQFDIGASCEMLATNKG